MENQLEHTLLRTDVDAEIDTKWLGVKEEIYRKHNATDSRYKMTKQKNETCF